MKITSLVTALPEPSATGWGTVSTHINAELKKLALVHDLHLVNDGIILKQDFPVAFNVPVLQAVRGVDMLPMYRHLLTADGIGHIGYSFVEDDILLKRYAWSVIGNWDVVAVGSYWAFTKMTEALALVDNKVTQVVTAVQGVDCDVFCPMQESRPDPEWFTIFSGGKWEFRKSQDVVIRAVAVLMERHRDVRLVAAWHNPWPHSAETMRASKLIDLSSSSMNQSLILAANGIKSNFQLIGECDNPLTMARHMNRCDIGLFPNRCEAGTNLFLMEAMACALPVIATDSHGHADVTSHIQSDFRLKSEPFIHERGGIPVGEWYEPDLDQVIAVLELAYNSRGTVFLKKEGARHRKYMQTFTWAKCAQALIDACS